jgi:transcriptional regulator with XRE-family HTH domain
MNVSRDMLANIESGRTQITDKHIMAFQKAFGVQIVLLFPKTVQELDEIYASRKAARSLKISGNRKQ